MVEIALGIALGAGIVLAGLIFFTILIVIVFDL
jgi:hypothetical protein